jgi:hypothetical protein
MVSFLYILHIPVLTVTAIVFNKLTVASSNNHDYLFSPNPLERMALNVPHDVSNSQYII